MPDILVQESARAAPALSATSDMPALESAAETAAETSAVEPQVEATEAAETPPTDKGKEGETPAAEVVEQAAEGETVAKPAKKSGLSERMSELTTARKQAESRADSLATALADANATIKKLAEPKPAETAKPAEAEDPRPNRETFDNPNAYEEALIEWSTRTATKVAMAEAEKQRLESEANTKREVEEKSQREATEALQKTWQTKREKAVEEFPDYSEVAERDDLSITIPMAHAILNAENGPAMAYHLGKNPEEAARIAALSPPLQVFELGKIAAELARPKTNVSRAPAPIRPVGNRSAAVAKTPDEMDMNEYATWRQSQLSEARKRAH